MICRALSGIHIAAILEQLAFKIYVIYRLINYAESLHQKLYRIALIIRAGNHLNKIYNSVLRGSRYKL